MDYLLYNFIGIKTDYFKNIAAIKIQKCYKNYKLYQKNIRFDIIFRKRNNIISNKKINEDNKIELQYWYNIRNQIKNKDWIFI